jgi:hypothetical protein
LSVVMVISIIIVFIVLFLAVITTSKAYSFKHTVDTIDELPDLENKETPKKEED